MNKAVLVAICLSLGGCVTRKAALHYGDQMEELGKMEGKLEDTVNLLKCAQTTEGNDGENN